MIPPIGTGSIALTLTAVQRKKLNRLLQDATAHVPLYSELYTGTEVLTLDPQTFTGLPLLTKAELMATPADRRLDGRFASRDLVHESTTGSTGQPFTLLIDKRYRRRRNLRFLRALASTGYRPWQRLLMLTDRFPDLRRTLGTRYYESVLQPTGDLARVYQQIRPQVLYGFTTSLRLLADRLLQSGTGFHRPNVVVATAELLDPGTRQRLETAFACPVYDFYGLTETGLVAWQQPGVSGYRLATNSVLTEFIPDESSTNLYKIVVTNLDLRASPIIRFDTGDLASVEVEGGQPTLVAIAGRQLDTIICRNGNELSPYRITDSLLTIPDIKRFKVVQRDLLDICVDLEVEDEHRPRVEGAVIDLFGQLLGSGLSVECRFCDRIISEGTRKFRPVESLVRRN